MPSKDTIPFHLTKKTAEEIQAWRKKIAITLGIDIKEVKQKQGEVALRLSSKRGSVKIEELNDIILGKIK